MEKTGCKIICGATATLSDKGLMMMMMMISLWVYVIVMIRDLLPGSIVVEKPLMLELWLLSKQHICILITSTELDPFILALLTMPLLKTTVPASRSDGRYYFLVWFWSSNLVETFYGGCMHAQDHALIFFLIWTFFLFFSFKGDNWCISVALSLPSWPNFVFLAGIGISGLECKISEAVKSILGGGGVPSPPQKKKRWF